VDEIGVISAPSLSTIEAVIGRSSGRCRRRCGPVAPYDTQPMPSQLAVHWTLDRSIAFLNHGSFGATPRPVLDAQTAWRERMEREPVAFFIRDLEPALDAARAELAAFVGADPDDLAFVVNATAGINTVARGMGLGPGEEVIVLDHAYNAARNAFQAVADAAGAHVVTAALPFPGTARGDALAAILDALTPRTRLVLLDHVTSPTALVLPVAEIVAALEERGIDALVDGAHAPGMVDVDIDRIGAAYYTANCHKWMSAPKGSGFLHVRRDRQGRIRPLAVSHGANSPRTDRSRFRLEHDWTGTLDPSAWLAVPAAIAFGATLVPGGWAALRERGHRLALDGRRRIAKALGTQPAAPEEMIGSMASVPMHEADPAECPAIEPDDDRVHAALVAAGVQVAVTPWPRDPQGGPWRRLIRFSCAPYVDAGDLDRLVEALATMRVAS
jgi:isopenicillin-N epimerase